MNILNELTVKNLKQNKKRTIVTMFGILLSVALVTAITAFVSSMQGSMLEREIKKSGNYHILVNDVPVEEQKYLLHNEKVEKVMAGQTIGTMDVSAWTEREEESEEDHPIVKVRAFTDEMMKELGVNLTVGVEGRLPKNENEILVQDSFIGLVKGYKVGDSITLTLDGKEKTYTITGLLQRPSYDEGWMRYTFITKLDHDISGRRADFFLRMKHPRDVYKFAEELEKDGKFSIGALNDGVIQFQGVTRSENTMLMLYTIAAIVILIIVGTSVFVIKNSFDISITERMKQYGMLASVGATSKQIRRNVMFEGFLLGITAIPLGVLSGIFAIWVTLLVVMKILRQTNLADSIVLSVHLSAGAIGVAVIIAIVTIYISSLIPAAKAAKVSPIDAIRESENIKISGRTLRTSKLLQRMLGVEGEIASKNLKRSKKKYRTTVFSIFLSVVLFVSISSVVKYAFMLQNLEYKKKDFNLEVHIDSDEMTREEELELCQRVEKLDGIKQSLSVKKVYANIQNGDYTKEARGDEWTGAFSQKELDEMAYLEVFSLPEKAYRDYIGKLGLTYEEANGKIIIADQEMTSYYDEKENFIRRKYNLLSSKEGDKISVSFPEDAEGNRKTAEWEIAKRTEQMPFGIEHNEDFGNEITIIISEEMMSTLDWRMSGVSIHAEDTAKLCKDIQAMDGNVKWYFNDYDAMMRENNSMVLIISIFLYGFIGVISAIGITNVFNTITTNMTLRSREFAILKSIGMTDKEFRRMIRYESVLYGMKALLFGIPVGVGLSYLMYRKFIGIMIVPYELPWMQMGIAAAAVFAIIFMTMGYSVRKTRNQNIIETIRSENI